MPIFKVLQNTGVLLEMSKALLIIGAVLTVAGVMMFLADSLPVDFLDVNSGNTYLKTVPTDSFSLLAYRLHFIVVGLALLVFYKFRDVFGF